MTRVPLASLGLLAGLLTFSLWHAKAARLDAQPTSQTARVPVLIELFTSEGCSDCPPANVLLAKLDRSQPIPAADLVVLSEHVDYWNDIGWKDPYSAHLFSLRQGDYARRFRLQGPYTPQMVVDGDIELVGSDERSAIHAVESAIKTVKIPVTLTSIRLEPNHTLAVHIDAGPLPGKPVPNQILLALADDSDQSSVSAGENSGRILKHVAVVRSLTQVGTIDSVAFSKDVKVDAENANPHRLRIVAFVQDAASGKVLGVGSAQLSN